MEDEGKNIWIYHSNGLYKYNTLNHALNHFDEKNNVSNSINCLFIDKSENLWAGGNEGLDVLNLYNKNIIHYTFKNAEVHTNSVNAIFKDETGNLFVATGDCAS